MNKEENENYTPTLLMTEKEKGKGTREELCDDFLDAFNKQMVRDFCDALEEDEKDRRDIFFRVFLKKILKI